MDIKCDLRKCSYSYKYKGGEYVPGYFHKWTEVAKPNIKGEYVRAIVENMETGCIELVNADDIRFLHD